MLRHQLSRVSPGHDSAKPACRPPSTQVLRCSRPPGAISPTRYSNASAKAITTACRQFDSANKFNDNPLSGRTPIRRNGGRRPHVSYYWFGSPAQSQAIQTQLYPCVWVIRYFQAGLRYNAQPVQNPAAVFSGSQLLPRSRRSISAKVSNRCPAHSGG